jgi:hypothetical protein
MIQPPVHALLNINHLQFRIYARGLLFPLSVTQENCNYNAVTGHLGVFMMFIKHASLYDTEMSQCQFMCVCNL